MPDRFVKCQPNILDIRMPLVYARQASVIRKPLVYARQAQMFLKKLWASLPQASPTFQPTFKPLVYAR